MERIKKYEPLWGKWTVKRIIGEGSFGAVYEVESEKLGNRSSCAVKLISFKNAEMLQGVKDGETLSSEELKQLKIEEARKNVREAVLMEKLQGRDHIVTIYDYDIFPGDTTTDVIIRMELLTNLNDYMKEHRIDSGNDLKNIVIKLGIDIGQALEECEAEKIVHRDIKPDNIFINKNGTFKLGDFGLSRKMNKSASFSLRKSAGTPLYMAPETFGWGSKTDYLSDIYSLGIVMYQLLNDGNIPFVSDMSDFTEVDNAIGRRLDREKILPPKYEHGELWKVLQKACEFEKKDRYQEAREFRKALEKLKNESKVEQKKEQEERRTEPVKEEKHYNEGESVWFGIYPQEADGTKKPIEWIVLSIKDDRALLLSKYILEGKKYNEEDISVTWETSDIRRWLNKEFYDTAFNNIEQQKVLKTLVETEDNPDYETDGGNNTEDKVFLLSLEEVQRFFIADGLEDLFSSTESSVELDNPEAAAKATEYAKQLIVSERNGTEYVKDFVDADEKTGNSSWWLRSPGNSENQAITVYDDIDDGGIWTSGEGWDVVGSNGVRPAIWVSLEE